LFKVSNYELRNPSSVNDIAHIVFKLIEKKIVYVSKLYYLYIILFVYCFVYERTIIFYRIIISVVFINGVEKKYLQSMIWWPKWLIFLV
jgi:hypothetical protein